MPWSIVVQFTPAGATRTPDLGRAAQAWFLSRVRQADLEFAEQLHRGDALRPYTVAVNPDSGLGGPWLRLTSLCEALDVVLDRVALEPPRRISLADHDFEVLGVMTAAEQHLWAGRESYDGLMQRCLFQKGPPPTRFEMEFVTATAFHSEGRHLPFPMPGPLFESWLNKWNQFGPAAISPELRRYAETSLAVSRYRLVSRVVGFGSSLTVGFVGRCAFRALQPDPYWLRLLHLLAAYSFWCGTGHRVTRGMGVTRLVNADA